MAAWKRKPLSAGEIRFRVSRTDLDRIEALLTNSHTESISALLRTLIYEAYCRLAPAKKEK